MSRKATYKPLLFTTTMRNPERLKAFLGVLRKYDGKILDDNLSENIAGEIIRYGLYKPTVLPARIKKKIKEGVKLTNAEVKRALRDNPQNHQEAGFSKGWPSRFDTWFKFAKELGFVFYQPDEKIQFSEIGQKLVVDEHPGIERQAFLNAFAKYQSNSPFRRVLNENAPLVLLLQTISKLNEDRELSAAGITKAELPLLIYWKNSDAEALYQRIKKLRNDFGHSPSGEVIVQICREEIMRGQDVRRNPNSILADYPDDFIRKMRLTGLVSLRGGGRFIDINRNEQVKVNYIMEKYSKYDKHYTVHSYFDYISTIDQNLVSDKSKKVSTKDKEVLLAKWANIYPWAKIKGEMKRLGSNRLSDDAILKYLPGPIRLEFLSALAVKSRFPAVRVIPNYPVDDEGIPTSTAGGVGDMGDIECFENSNGILIEVTMAQGRMQTVMEIWPIGRHLGKFSNKVENAICYFVAPSIFSDSKTQIAFLKKEENKIILPKTIGEFIECLENSKALYESP